MLSITLSPGATIISGPHGAIKRISAIVASLGRLFKSSSVHSELDDYLVSKNIQNAAEADFYVRQFEQHKFNQRFL